MKAKPETLPGEGRIAKILARAGVCSRREAEALITQGRVSVDGEVLLSPALNVSVTQDIRVDGIPIPQADLPRLWRYHKPRGVVTTNRDPQGRPTVFEALPKDLPRVMSIGRLDFNSEGLLLLTNDGELARRMELPATALTRRYRVRVFGKPDPGALERLMRGVTVEGQHYGPIKAELEREQGDNSWLSVSLREGKNREVRKVLLHLGMQVNRLIRVAYGPFQLGDLKIGGVDELPTVKVMEQLGVFQDKTGWAKAAQPKKRGVKKK
ncbi:MAG: rRNA pseudouridine synthase [Alphaproteobacteria bacterium]|nr:rRNA pseudouridine synthase [Alphaproteobacteria bacterium]